MAFRLEDGWLIVDCGAPPTSRVEIAVGTHSPVAAFRGNNTAMIRVPAGLVGRPRVQLIVDGITETVQERK